MEYSQFFKPLAFKGPDDQLAQLFGDSLLYEAMQFLLKDELLEWHFEKEDATLFGHFFRDKKLIKSTLRWPLKLSRSYCPCLDSDNEEAPCIHKAALAIAAKAELDRLPLLVKPRQKVLSDAEYFNHWLQQPPFDPYPNMARHRLVYVIRPITEEDKVSDGNGFVVLLQKSYLNKDGSFTPKAAFDPNSASAEKRPKFVTDSDLWILSELVKKGQWLSNQHGFLLSKDTDPQLVKIMLMSGRCFWRSGHRRPLELEFLPISTIAGQTFFDGFCFSTSMQSVGQTKAAIDLVTAVDDNLASNDSEMEQSQLTFCLHLESTHSQRSAGPKQRIDLARFFVVIADKKYSLSQLASQFSRLTSNQINNIQRAIRMLDGLQPGWKVLEPIEAVEFDIGDRVLAVATEVNWLQLYCLYQNGWQINFDKSFFMDQLHLDDWYLKVEARQRDSDPTETKAISVTNDKQQLAFEFDTEPKRYNHQRSNERDDWFKLELGVEIKGKRISLIPWLNQLVDSEKDTDVEIKLESGQMICLPAQRVNTIRNTFLELIDKEAIASDTLTVQRSHLVLLNSLTAEDNFKWISSTQIKKLARQLSDSSARKKTAIPKQLKADLRGYQKHGLGWLQFLWNQGFGGILADDMGLGKTLQTIASILYLKENKELSLPVLIVVPTSLIFNWLQEFARFAPDLLVQNYFGQQRKQQRETIFNSDVIVTSYGVMARDIEWLERQIFSLVVLDEAQNIKNHKTQNARASFRLISRNRLCLTGTPVENHLGELWSLYHFLMPGFLGNIKQFNRNFREPIEQHNDRVRSKILSQRLQPFMLRRLKEEVAKELPAKTEIYEYLPLTETQNDVYELVRLSASKELDKQILSGSQQSNSVLIANALLRLRQICCHPALVSDQVGHDFRDSNKYDWLLQKLPEFIENKRHILIFSQFTRVLDDLENLLDSVNISFLTLKGKTQNRQSLVEKFQAGEASVFLISLKAGGTGLNLTRADTVIHLDPWWNAAAELQASDRAYRIGQDKPVFVYKLISENTVEQRIQSLQQLKSKLADDLFAGQSSAKLTNEEWMDLLKPMSEFEELLSE